MYTRTWAIELRSRKRCRRTLLSEHGRCLKNRSQSVLLTRRSTFQMREPLYACPTRGLSSEDLGVSVRYRVVM